MIAEGTLGNGVTRFDIPLDNDLRTGGNPQRDAPAGNRGKRGATQKTGKSHFIKSARQGKHGAEKCCRVAAQYNRHRHRLARKTVLFCMPGRTTARFPLDGNFPLAAQLDPVHSAILRAAIRIGSENLRQGDVARMPVGSAVARPALQKRETGPDSADPSGAAPGRLHHSYRGQSG